MLTVIGNRAVNSNDFVTPIKVAEIFEKFLEHLERSIELIMKVIQEKSHENVQSVGGHIGCVRSEQSSIESQPALKKQDGFLQQIVLADKFRNLLNEIESEKTTELTYTYIDGSARNFEFYD